MDQLHVFFFPLLAHGHMLPTLDMAKLFSSRGLKTTLITTHHHAPMFNRSIEKSLRSGFQISVRSIRFPAAEAGLPEGFESLAQVKSEDDLNKFTAAIGMLQEPTEQLLQECRPHCLVSDIFYPWTTDSAQKFGIPRLYFHGSCSFVTSVTENIKRYKPYKNVTSDSDSFLLPGFPHQIKVARSEIHESLMLEEKETDFSKQMQQISDSNARSYGAIVNSFYELESVYVRYNRENFGMRAWNIGPLFLQINEAEEDKAQRRGKESSIDQHKCLKWLDLKEPNSVVFVCFGSLAQFSPAQSHEIASGLERSGQNFIWVVRNSEDDEETARRWIPEGFEERMEGRGLIIKGWAPQLLILEHESVGAFVTHCGWNSALEGLCAGVPMITWPLFGDQFFNQKLLVEILKIGISVGAQNKNSFFSSEVVKGDCLAMAVGRAMVGEEAVEMRNRVQALKEMAKNAVENGGSSYSDFYALIEELKAYHHS